MTAQTYWSISTSSADGAVWVHVAGEVDLTTVARLREAVDRSLELGPAVWIDLEDVTFIDASAIHVLLDAQREATSRGTCLLIRPCASAMAMRPFTLLGLEEQLPFATSSPRRGSSPLH